MKTDQKFPSRMEPAWRRLLLKHQGKTFCELDRPKITDRVSGIVADFSDSLILLHSFEWDTFSFNGFGVVRDVDVQRIRLFRRAKDWRNAALEKMQERPTQAPQVNLFDWASCITSAAERFPLLAINCEITKPDVCYIGFPLKVTEKTLILDSLNTNCEWTKPVHIKLSDITRINFNEGYERALAATAPARKR
ncbi:hypothetical protein SAMN05444156_0320 [Verrucomicrobium sp. GAS474]|uniref:hypothetical protein n=1 Tax=Verrucomicrobium sp. GAS474 TaxID=1882831 RepID=UPI00087C8DA7|nr:hypothetical protein [Verrucomicrobium sp. GAS474]SDT87553.1 hypothetical protein SAMN05444156_0320 [Verrucomicrobium sp. GAS474]